ncbi:hypothetical protein BJX61DRAFT_400335 [Aspergillus egyptiacus]|nr:hypothetical protein BJX61DRAFT_400335 [Aspergillus egyptiacus]
MRFDHSLSATFIFALILTTSASRKLEVSTTDPDLRTGDVSTAAWQDIIPEPGTNESGGNNKNNARERRVTVDPFMVPYPSQTGPTRYAPLAKKPGTAIATAAPTPQFPASSYKIATEYLAPATVETTLSASETASATMIENTAAPVVHPA